MPFNNVFTRGSRGGRGKTVGGARTQRTAKMEAGRGGHCTESTMGVGGRLGGGTRGVTQKKFRGGPKSNHLGVL